MDFNIYVRKMKGEEVSPLDSIYGEALNGRCMHGE